MKVNNRCLKLLKQLIIISLCISTFLGIWLIHKVDPVGLHVNNANSSFKSMIRQSNNILPVFIHQQPVAPNVLKSSDLNLLNKTELPVLKIERQPKLNMADDSNGLRLALFDVDAKDYPPCYEIHTFYYPWYGNPQHDGKYIHWNHPFLPHWNKKEAKKWRQDSHVPPDDVGANFYPSLGPYSSKDVDVVDKHMQIMRFARIGKQAWFFVI